MPVSIEPPVPRRRQRTGHFYFAITGHYDVAVTAVTRCIDPRRSTCSNVGLFEVVAFGRLLCSRTIPAGRSSLPPQPGTPPGVKHETPVPTVEDPSCAHA